MNKLIRRKLALTSALRALAHRGSENDATVADRPPVKRRSEARHSVMEQRNERIQAGLLRHQGINE
jgi:hypothetical protein